MEKYFWTIIIIIVIGTVVITTTIYALNTSNNEEDLDKKVEEELKYISKEIIDMMNSLNNISFTNSAIEKRKQESSKDNSQNSQASEDGKAKENKTEQTNIKYTTVENGILNSDNLEVDWNNLKNKAEKLYSIWTTTLIDLHSLNVNNEDILSFSNQLDIVTSSINSQDKNISLNNLAVLYEYIPMFLQQIGTSKQKILIEDTKSNILNSYVFVEAYKWDEVDKQIRDAIDNYSGILNNAEENNEFSKNKLIKIYVLLNELYNTNDIRDNKIYYLKYKRVMEELSNLQ